MILKLEKLSRSARAYRTGERIVDVLWKTLSGDGDDMQRGAPFSYAEAFEAFKEYQEDTSDKFLRGAQTRLDVKAKVHSFIKAALNVCRDRQACLTRQGYVGLVPEEAQVGDSVCIIAGEDVPFVISEAGEHWRLVGDAYFHGLMGGGEASLNLENQVEMRIISLV